VHREVSHLYLLTERATGVRRGVFPTATERLCMHQTVML
jgi:hypothetical protein